MEPTNDPLQRVVEIEPTAKDNSFKTLISEELKNAGYNEDAILKTYVYRIEGNNKNGSYIDTYDMIPEIENIAYDFGAGKYKIVVHAKPDEETAQKAIKGFTFTVDSVHGKGKKYLSPGEGEKSPLNQISNAGTSIEQITAIAGLITPLIQSMRPDPMLQQQQMQVMMQMQQTQFENNIKLMNSMQDNFLKQKLELIAMVDEPTTPEPQTQLSPLVEMILPLIDMYANKLLSPGGNVIASKLKNSEEYQEIKSDAEQLAILKQGVIDSQGEEKAQKLFTKLDV